MFLFRFVFMPIRDNQIDLANKTIVIRKNIDDANLLGQELTNLKRQTRLKSISLSKKIDSLLRQNNLKARSNIVLEEQPSGGQRLILKLDELNLTELSNIIFKIENTKPVMMIENIDINPSFKNKKLLRISMAITGN